VGQGGRVRESRFIMADLAGTGLTPEQMGLMMELSSSLAAEARPIADEAAERRRERDRAYQAEKRAGRRQSLPISADSADIADAALPLDKKPPDPKKLNPIPGEYDSTPAREPVEILASVIDALATAHLKRWRNLPPPPSVSDEQWQGFIDHRRAHPKGGKFTDRAYTLLCNKLVGLAEHGFPPGDMIDLAIERGWITVFEPTEVRNGLSKSTAQQGNGLRGSRPSPALELARRGAAREAEEAHLGQDGAADWGTGPPIQAFGTGGP
jgi:hypothetical protein